jgi:hypothetical protein
MSTPVLAFRNPAGTNGQMPPDLPAIARKAARLLATDQVVAEIVEQLIDDLLADCEAFDPTVLRAVTSALRERLPHLQGAHREPATEIWMRVQQLASGKERTFWFDATRSFLKCKDRQFDTIVAVQDFADAYLTDYLTARKKPVDPNRTIAAEPYTQFVQRGTYRVVVNGLPTWMEQKWAGGSPVLPAH